MNSPLLTLFVGFFLLSAPSHAQNAPAVPDAGVYAGTWSLDAVATDPASDAGAVTLVITHAANHLRMDTTRGGTTQTILYRLDGSENLNAFGSGTALSRVQWRDGKLVT